MPKFLVFDSVGRFVHIAEGIARTDPVCYYTHARSGFPDALDYLPGKGLDNIEWIQDPYEHLDSVDCVVFPDVGEGHMQEYLRAHGKPVFGAGKYSDIECDRRLMRTEGEAAGYEIGPGQFVRGTKLLRALLEEEDERYVKISFLRATMETFHHINAKVSKVWLDNLEQRLGPYASQAEFIVQEPIDHEPCVEVGLDTFVADGCAVETTLWGYEIKDAFHAATIAALPPKLQRSLKRHLTMVPDYRGALSNELRVVPRHEYLIDVTHRFGFPPSPLQAFGIENFADVIYGAATGDLVEPDFCAPIMVQINLTSEWFQKHPLALECEHPDRVALIGKCVIDDQTYAVNVMGDAVENIVEFGAACGYGTTLEKAIADAIDAADCVSGLYVSYNKGSMQKGLETIRDGNKLEIAWGGTAKLPMED